MLIQAIDDKLYKNPVIYLEYPDSYYRNHLLTVEHSMGGCVRVNDADTLICLINNQIDKKLINGMLESVDLICKPIGLSKLLKRDCVLYLLPPDYRKMCKVWEFEIKLNGPIPIPNEYEYVTDLPDVKDNYLAWKLPFTLGQIKHFVENPDEIRLIHQFLLNTTIFEDMGRAARRVRGKLFKQFPKLKEQLKHDRLSDVIYLTK